MLSEHQLNYCDTSESVDNDTNSSRRRRHRWTLQCLPDPLRVWNPGRDFKIMTQIIVAQKTVSNTVILYFLMMLCQFLGF